MLEAVLKIRDREIQVKSQTKLQFGKQGYIFEIPTLLLTRIFDLVVCCKSFILLVTNFLIPRLSSVLENAFKVKFMQTDLNKLTYQPTIRICEGVLEYKRG